ncbi:sugar ABC transporter substrate-binding protein [Paenibacillus bovis]|uniref:LacI family transcriptional regulator n=1 Tax=Paenibacillus bovis TaxID=1616788 RepID=A0A172ZC78_9BACL|nr:sugar ABC transporter substrate-binding protein [Paenibacillus bovis]ANF94972.1 LacI family transcriptional regulator [Paenibacillus bovis]
MRRRLKSISVLSILLVFAVILGACGNNSTGNNASGSADAASDQPLAGKNIALIMRLNNGTFSAQYIDGVKSQVAKYGGNVTVISADNDLSKMASSLDAAVNQGQFDGILIDHGDAGALTAGVQKAVQANIPVIAFDSALDGIPGVTSLAQNDQKMAELTLDQLAKDAGGKGNIVKIWVAGFPPMESRQISYKAFQGKYPDIKEIAAFGTADNAQLDAQTQMEAILKQYPNKGDIAAVWASWDEFAKGASNAIKQAGRDDIKVYGIDLSDEDLSMIQDPSSPWVASAAVDPTTIGRVQVRYLYQKFAGNTSDQRVELEPVYVKRDDLPKDKKVTTADLGEYVKGWGDSDQGNTDELKALEKAIAAGK